MLALRRQVSNVVSHICPRCRHNPYRQFSYSQDGEDRVLRLLMGDRANGFYVDVGAHHPKRWSNTYLFHEQGWRGINIEPTPGTAALFHEARPGDITLEVGVARERGELLFHQYEEPAYNTFNEASHLEFLRRGTPRPIGDRKVPVLPLRDILAEHLPEGTKIDFLSIDAEGLDFDVIESNDWDRFRPRVVVSEYNQDFAALSGGRTDRFLSERGYRLAAATTLSAFFVLRNDEAPRRASS